MITDIPPSYQEKPAEMVRKHTHVNTTSGIKDGTLFHLLSGARTSGLLPRGMKKEVRSSWSINLQNKPASRMSSILLCLRSCWRNSISLILLARHWASASSSGREPATTSVSGSTASKNQTCTRSQTHILHSYRQNLCTPAHAYMHVLHMCMCGCRYWLGETPPSPALNVKYK